MTKSSKLTEQVASFEAVQRRIADAQGLLFEESDRGCVLVAGAMLDDSLRALFKSFSVDDKSLAKELFDRPEATLSSFSSRIHLARALALITHQLYRDLHRVRLVRNMAAHFDRKGKRAVGFSFADSDVAGKCRASPRHGG